jgi:hypothetical protein
VNEEDAHKLGCLSTLKHLHLQGRLKHKQLLCAAAAGAGQLVMLRWVHANGCPWDEYKCAYAAGFGHLEMLQWSRANGCPWDSSTSVKATELGVCQGRLVRHLFSQNSSYNNNIAIL